MSSDPLADLEYRAEFERQQFELYEARRLAEETHASAVMAAAVAVAAFVLAGYGRKSHPGLGWLVVALVGLLWAFALATNARVVSWETPRWRGGIELTPVRSMLRAISKSDRVKSTVDAVHSFFAKDERELPSDCVKSTLNAVRNFSGGNGELFFGGDRELRQRVIKHWQARQFSAWRLGSLKGRRLRWSLCGFVGPLVYFAVRLLMM